MANHTITLNWGSAGFQPDVDPVLVQTGDTISFQLGDAPPNSTFKITMEDSHSFSPAEVSDSNTPITVVTAEETTYQCQVLDASGSPLFTSGAGQGGHVKPG
jgi:hypothetical protein